MTNANTTFVFEKVVRRFARRRAVRKYVPFRLLQISFLFFRKIDSDSDAVQRIALYMACGGDAVQRIALYMACGGDAVQRIALYMACGGGPVQQQALYMACPARGHEDVL